MITPRRALAAAFAALAVGGGCARERVEVADVDGGDEGEVTPPLLHPRDGSVEARVDTCGPAPVIGLCAECPHGFVTLPDSGPSCTCCP